eukprot:Partr_v1_DN27043_c1_g1_i1_m28839 putative member RAS oncogene family
MHRRQLLCMILQVRLVSCSFRCVDLMWLFWQKSFQKAKNWIAELRRQASPDIVIALAGNKIDLLQNLDDGATVDYVATDFAQVYADSQGLLFYETSAKTGVNIVELFTDIARKVPQDKARFTSSSSQSTPMDATQLGKSPSIIDIHAHQQQQQKCTC